MARGSVRENKTVYQIAREEKGFTILEASIDIGISESKIEKIESGVTKPQPQDVYDMAVSYDNKDICAYYCNNECPLGTLYNPKVVARDLPTVTLEIVNMLNKLEEDKDRLVEITVDGKVSKDELADFNDIRDELEKVSAASIALKQWVDETLKKSQE